MRMNTPMKLRNGTLVTLVVLGFTAGVGHASDAALLSLPMEHFRDTAIVNTDAAAGKTTISTENGFVDRSGLRTVWNDEFLTGVTNTTTGKMSIQVEARITYSGHWRQYETVNYLVAGSSQSAATTLIDKNERNCTPGDCTYTEHVAFPIDEQVLRGLAAGYVPGKPTLWANKFIAKSGPDSSGSLSNAEIAGFLAKADQYTHRDTVATTSTAAALPPVSGAVLPVAPAVAAALAVPAPVGTSPSPNKPDFGIGGVPLAATVEMPTRAGVLITAVTHGSVAQKAGIIAGDVLYEIDQRPVKTLAALEAAIDAHPVHSTAMIKLFRGTDVKVVAAHF